MRAYLIEGFLLVAVTVVGIVNGFVSLNRVLFQNEALSPGWYLIAVSFSLLVCVLLYMAQERKHPETAPAVGHFRSEPTVVVWGSMLAYATLIPLVGYALASFLFFTVVFYLLGMRPWFRTGIMGLVFAGAFYLGFVSLANVFMPSGWIGPIFERLW